MDERRSTDKRMDSFKVIIAGSREFNDYELLKSKLGAFLINKKNITIVSGAARGADKLGEKYARERGYEISSHPANWDEHGKSAGYIRNDVMAKIADACVVFWNGESKGTKHMIDLVNKYNLPLRIITYEGD